MAMVQKRNEVKSKCESRYGVHVADSFTFLKFARQKTLFRFPNKGDINRYT